MQQQVRAPAAIQRAALLLRQQMLVHGANRRIRPVARRLIIVRVLALMTLAATQPGLQLVQVVVRVRLHRRHRHLLRRRHLLRLQQRQPPLAARAVLARQGVISRVCRHMISRMLMCARPTSSGR